MMADLNQHPTVRHFYEQERRIADLSAHFDADELRSLCLESGADDVGFVEIDRLTLAGQRADILAAFPPTRTLISFVCRMNREPLRSPARSIANTEFHHGNDRTNEVGHAIVTALAARGVRAINVTAGFPMEAQNFPNKIWVVSHKPVAVAAGLGQMGIHRNVIHPKFGNYILLGTVLIEAEVSDYSQPIDYNPCLECKLCVAVCPVGAISPEGEFNFTACYTHNYREFLGGFNDWVNTVADSKNAADYNEKVTPGETSSLWQSLSFGANYKSAYCMAVCPAGEDVIGPFLTQRKEYLREVVRPLQDKPETIYVTAGSAAEVHVMKRFPHKRVKRVGNGIRSTTIEGFLNGLRLVFQPQKAEGVNCTYHFTFTGDEKAEATVIIQDQKLTVLRGHEGHADIAIVADSRTWLRFIAKQTNILAAIIRRRIRIKGNPRLLIAFGKCFAV